MSFLVPIRETRCAGQTIIPKLGETSESKVSQLTLTWTSSHWNHKLVRLVESEKLLVTRHQGWGWRVAHFHGIYIQEIH